MDAQLHPLHSLAPQASPASPIHQHVVKVEIAKRPDPPATISIPSPSAGAAHTLPTIIASSTSTSKLQHQKVSANPPEPFPKDSALCLDGRITCRSEHVVASGGLADVWTGSLGSQMVAIKITRPFSSIGTRIQKSKLLKRLWREYLAWSCLSHPNIIQCLGFSYDFTRGSEHELPCLVSPWMSNGTALEYIENDPSVDRVNLLVGIAAGLSYLHNRIPAIVHGDLRAGNVLVSNAGDPCLTDFGLARILNDTRGMTTSSEVAGSLRWMSSELIRDEMPRESSDVWAYGMTVLEIATGKRPYSEVKGEPAVLHQILDGRVPPRPVHDKSAISDQLWAICQRCWIQDPTQRPSMREVMGEYHSIDSLTAGRPSSMPPPYAIPFHSPLAQYCQAPTGQAAGTGIALSDVNNDASSSTSSSVAPPATKRKRDPSDEPGTSNDVYIKKPNIETVAQPWPTGSDAITGSHTSQASNQAPPCDDKEGHYIVTADDMIYDRYRTMRLLGQGNFGKVVEAVDTRSQSRVAVKIIRAIPKYRDASKIEIRVLNRLKERDPHNIHKCIHLLECFDHRNHICIVTELLGKCVYDFLKENDFVAFPRAHIQSFARQLLDSVAFLHSQRLVHTGLKPESILLVRNNYHVRALPQPANGRRKVSPKTRRELESTDIRLADFGSATFDDEYHSTVVSTRHYRAPEVILGLGWSFPCDAFSLGCILVEFYTGVALFQTHDNLEHLAMMEAVMGKMPDKFARAGARSKPEFFKVGAKLAWPTPRATQQSKKEVKATKALQEIVLSTDSLNRHFLDLVRKLLTFDPAYRITVADALQHPYFITKPPSD